MRIARSTGAVVLLAMVSIGTPGSGQGDPVDEKNWLNEKTWPAFVAARQLEAADNDDALTKLLKERYNAGQKELRDRYVYWLQGEESLPQVYDAARRVIEARLEAGGPRSNMVTILKEKVAFAWIVEKQAKGLLKKFNHSRQASDVDCATYFRATVELELLRAQKAAKGDVGQ